MWEPRRLTTSWTSMASHKFIEVEVILRLTVSQYVLVSSPLWDLRPDITSCGLVSVGRPLWREHWSAVCSVITLWSESRRTRNDTLLFHLRLLQPGGAGSRIYIPIGWPSYAPGTCSLYVASYDSQGYGAGILTPFAHLRSYSLSLSLSHTHTGIALPLYLHCNKLRVCSVELWDSK
jgi:hypothetical protein